MEFTEADFDRLLMFEHARKTAESNYESNPVDAENLTKWGEALIELSQFQTGAESKNMIKEGISKLEEALSIEPTKHVALWTIGNAHALHGFMTPDVNEAKVDFEKASVYFQGAVDEDPTNELYLKSLTLSSKAPEFHMEFAKQGLGAEVESSASSNAKGSKKKKSCDLKYDICGWIILAVGLVAWVGMAKSNLPPPAPPSRF